MGEIYTSMARLKCYANKHTFHVLWLWWYHDAIFRQNSMCYSGRGVVFSAQVQPHVANICHFYPQGHVKLLRMKIFPSEQMGSVPYKKK